MKNKKNIYILLPIVLLIWGLVIYEFFSFSNYNADETIVSEVFKVKPIKIKERQTVSIAVNYRDPFLGKMYTAVQNKTVAKKKVTTPTPKKIIDPIVWPSILYKGIVSDTKDKNKVFMLIIDGQTFLMKKGSTEREVFLKEGDRESIEVKYKGSLDYIFIAE
jgi:hypothetical protein